MAISDKVKAVLALAGKKQQDLAQAFGMTKQTMSNKFARDSWSGKDLAKVAELVGGQLAIIMLDGQTITLDIDEDGAGEK